MPNAEGRENHDEKRGIINSLESLRRAPCPEAINEDIYEGNTSVAAKEVTKDDLLNEVKKLEKELKLAKSTNVMLEGDLKRMEYKALDAIAESGNLKRMLEQTGGSCRIDEKEFYLEREEFLQKEKQSRNDHFMLTQALIDSENEISRLTKTLEKLSRKLGAA